MTEDDRTIHRRAILAATTATSLVAAGVTGSAAAHHRPDHGRRGPPSRDSTDATDEPASECGFGVEYGRRYGS
ncbi:hypothetical protein [Natronorubrum texcoconense]|uniref:hypothetical protein n=1 Tax=Natronorubrum texcoconense TaxID=1095776 RepID=UPI000B7F5200|nr:hypothetical protein [Natronorubrum texcoconense]